MHAATLLAFSVVALIAIATPGPTVLPALANGSRFGLRRSVAGMFGALASDFVLVGAAYLAWLGWRLLRSQGGLDLAAASVASAQGEASARSVFGKLSGH